MVDWNRVRDLREEVGEEDFEEIVAMFLEETDAVVRELHKQTTAKALESNLHFLKGSALNIGMASLARICQAGEKAASQGQTDIDLAEIAQSYQKSRACLLDGLRAQAAA